MNSTERQGLDRFDLLGLWTDSRRCRHAHPHLHPHRYTHTHQYDELSRFVREEVDSHLKEHQRLEAKHAELSQQWDRLIRVWLWLTGS